MENKKEQEVTKALIEVKMKEKQAREAASLLRDDMDEYVMENASWADFGDDFVDSFVSWATHLDGTEFTDEELEILNNDTEWLFEAAYNNAF